MGRLREYHYEVSQPRRNPSDNHYYQRVRQVDAEGRLTAFGERIFKSTRPGSYQGLFPPQVDLSKVGPALLDVGQFGLGALTKKPSAMLASALKFGRDTSSGIYEDYKFWPGTEVPWEPVLDWRKGGSRLNFVPPEPPGAIGDGRGIGSWWENTGPIPQSNPLMERKDGRCGGCSDGCVLRVGRDLKRSAVFSWADAEGRRCKIDKCANDVGQRDRTHEENVLQ